jgi:hypothetical protein
MEVTKERRLLELRAAARVELGRREVERRLEQHPWEWLTQYTQTFDEHAAEKGVPVHKPFPTKEYLRVVLRYLERSPRIFIPKSREMLTSWLVMGYCTQKAQYKKRTRVIIQTEKEEKGWDLVEYCRCLYNQQPEWLRRLHPLATGGVQSKGLLLWDNESRVRAIPSGANQVRQAHPTVLVLDEASFLPEAMQSYETANPVTSQIIAISSAGPGWFADMCERPVETVFE